MSRAYNFYAGPATLPQSVLARLQADLVDYERSGMSLIETSHRSPQYDAVHNKAISLIRSLLAVPETHDILLLGGGATLQFSMVPMNIGAGGSSASKPIAFTVSGSWAKKALSDAKTCATVDVLFDGATTGYKTLPVGDSLNPSNHRYLHITSNETIEGLQWKSFPVTGVPLVADMSSDILSRPLPVGDFGLIYAGAQKNLGPSGVTVVIVRKDLMTDELQGVPAYLRYATHAAKNSLYNTPPVFPIWALSLVLEWIEADGGLATIAERNQRKASALYDAIDGSGGFYACPVDAAFRSEMNVVFRLPSEEDEKRFVAGAAERGMIGLKGHRSVGGIRASIYNAMPEEGVGALIDYMKTFRA